MKLAMIGLGKMGANMTLRLLGGGHQVVACDRNPAVAKELAGKGAIYAADVADVVAKLEAPRVAWVMVPPGGPTDGVIDELASRMSKGDVIIDGGNSNW